MSSVVQVPSPLLVAPVDTPVRGIAYLVGGVAVFSLQDVVIKSLSGSAYPVLELVFFRSLLAILILALVGWHFEGRRAFVTRRPGLHLLRSAFGCVSYTSYYMAMATLPLADAVALFFAAPLFLTALSVPVLGERVGPHRWAAVVIGFFGVLVMLRPGATAFEPAALLSLLAALAYAAMQMVTRRLSANDSSICMSLSTNICYLGLAAITGLLTMGGTPDPEMHASLMFLVRPWSTPGAHDLGLMMLIGVIAAGGFVCLTRAYMMAPTSTVAPFEYTMMLWAIVWGLLFFGEMPDPVVLLGVLLTASAGLYVLHRERLAAAAAG